MSRFEIGDKIWNGSKTGLILEMYQDKEGDVFYMVNWASEYEDFTVTMYGGMATLSQEDLKDFTILEKRIFDSYDRNAKYNCAHTYELYTGLIETFEHCTKCKEKKI